jgi:hypothetical protein
LPSTLLDQEASRMLLARADTADAIKWGRTHGIALFEGRAAMPGQPTLAPRPI